MLTWDFRAVFFEVHYIVRSVWVLPSNWSDCGPPVWLHPHTVPHLSCSSLYRVIQEERSLFWEMTV